MRAIELIERATMSGFETSFHVDVSDEEVKAGLDAQALKLAKKTVPGLAAFFAAAAVLQEINLLPDEAPEFRLAAIVATACLTVLAVGLHRRLFQAQSANHVLVASAAVVSLYALVRLAVTQQADAAIYLILLLPGIAAAILSWSPRPKSRCAGPGGSCSAA